MYTLILILHSLMRWVFLFTAVNAIYRSFRGMSGDTYSETDRKAGSFFVMAADIQLVLGLILYVFLSPITQAVFQNMGAAMKDKMLRFWGIEHIFGMVVAWILIHVGWAIAKKIPDASARHKKLLTYFGIALLIIIFTIPWLMRPLLRISA